MERVICSECGKKVGGYVPRGGDGSALKARKHTSTGKTTCPGSYRIGENVVDE